MLFINPRCDYTPTEHSHAHDTEYTHEVLEISDAKGFRAHSDNNREKLKPILKELEELI
jgi:hypothetical protein